MRHLKWAFAAVLALAGGHHALTYAHAQTQAQATKPAGKATIAWAAKPAKPLPYTGPNRLVWRLADVLAAHKGKDNWSRSRTWHLELWPSLEPHRWDMTLPAMASSGARPS